jgi:hypothetical protein
MRSASRTLEAVPPAAVALVLVVLQLLAATALGHGQGWSPTTGDKVAAAVLLAVQVVLVYAVVMLVAGRVAALFAGLVLVAGPVVLAERYFQSGGGTPPIDYKTVYRHDVLPTVFGLTSRSGLTAACLLLASAWLVLARTRFPVWSTAALGSAAAVAAVLVYPRAWLALAAPVVATMLARRATASAAALVTVAGGLVALALFRNVPHVAFGWHQMGQSLDSVREFSWSRRVLEYLPLAGLFGLARRSAPAAGFFGVLLLALVILPLSRPLGLTGYLLALVPGASVYWLLTACIPFLVPRPAGVTSRAASTAATGR